MREFISTNAQSIDTSTPTAGLEDADMSGIDGMYSQRMFRGSKPLIGRDVEIGDDVSIGPNVVIGEPIADAYESSDYDNPPTLIEQSSIVRSGTVIYAGCSMDPGMTTGHYAVIGERTICGERCNFGAYYSSDGDTKIGDRCRFNYYTYICKESEIGDDVWMFPSSQFCSDMHPPCNECMNRLELGNRAVVGTGTIMLPKVRIGEDAVIAAGSLVTKNVPDRTFAAGRPARNTCPVSEVECKTGRVGHPYPWTNHYVRPR